jgi:hypothetical protein
VLFIKLITSTYTLLTRLNFMIMKTIGLVLLWFVVMGALSTLVSCGSAHHCDAYGQTEQVETKTVSK